MQKSEEKQIPKPQNDELKKVMTMPCPKCGYPVSIYYFTKVRDELGKVVFPICRNCGHWEDPE
jgi:DNA-directed RNA polymerase subunit M/transcription elongation factor TFIIS